MQSNRLILWSSLAALVLCAVPYGCAGKAISGGDASGSGDPTDTRQGPPVDVDGAYQSGDGNVVSSGSGMIGGTGFSVDGAYQGSDGVRYGDGASFPHGGDGILIQGDGYDYADGRDRGDGDPRIYFDGWDERGDGASIAEGWNDHGDGWADGNF
jgi:hypothetical protein